MPTPYLIGIAGPSGAGKSALAHWLARALPARIVALDSFYAEHPELPLEQRARLNYDTPGAIDHDLLAETVAALAQGRETLLPVYDFSQHARAAATERIRPGAFLILEGLFTLYWEDIRRRLGTSVFVATEDRICFERRLWRDLRERGRSDESVRRQYNETVRPMAEAWVLPTRRFADVVVGGTDPLERSAAAVLAHFRSAELALP